MPYSYALADRGSTLATRPLAKELRSDLTERAGDQQLVVLDFSGVAAASHSFADEFVAQLAEDSREGKVPFAITVCGASSEVDRIVRQALQRRDIDLPALVWALCVQTTNFKAASPARPASATALARLLCLAPGRDDRPSPRSS